MQEIYYTKKFTAGRTGNEFLAFSQNPLYQIFCRKSPGVKALFRIFGITVFMYNHYYTKFGIIVASSVWVLPSPISLVGVEPQSPRSARCAYLRILQNAP